MTPIEINVAIAEWCGKKCKLCNNTGIMRKFGKLDYAKMRASQEKWVKEWPEIEPDLPCDHADGVIPNYHGDLNAVHEADVHAATNGMDGDQWDEYGRQLEKVHPSAVIRACGPPYKNAIDYGDVATLITQLTAAQRCEALLKTIGKWVE